jgi:hypothetical protein
MEGMTKPALCLVLLLVFVPSAVADGLPLPVDGSETGVVSTDERTRYTTAQLDRDRTVVIAQTQQPHPGTVRGAALLDGEWTVPLVAYDGTAEGLSRNGRRLVLIRPRKRFPRRSTSFAVYAINPDRPGRMHLREVIQLRGDFSFDTLSPDGRSLFLIEYIDPKNPARYRVRVIDLRSGRLEPKPISDAHRIQTRMNGYPYARTASTDGRWVYTLYGGGHHAFVHALDTRTRSAHCIDLHINLFSTDVTTKPHALEFDATARTVRVQTDGSNLAAVIDARTYAVEYPPAARPHFGPGTEGGGEGGGAPWQALVGGASLLVAAGFIARRRRRRRRRELDAWLGAELGDLGPGAAVEERERRGEGAGTL